MDDATWSATPHRVQSAMPLSWTNAGVLSVLIERHLTGPRIDRKRFDVALLWADPWRIERLACYAI